MAKDFKASQVRTTQIIASGALSGKPSLIIASASSPGVNFDGGAISNSTLLNGIGKDVFLFVSGAAGSKNSSTVQGLTVFGGDAVFSGTAYNSSGSPLAAVAGSDQQVQFNDGGVMGADAGFTYDKTKHSLSHGNSVPATGDYSHAEGFSAQATGNYSHAEGYNTVASNTYSHAEGFGSQAAGAQSHAEGANTLASGNGSHAEGLGSIAAADYSHAGGFGSIAAADYSTTAGVYTIASGSGQTVVGSFNSRGNSTSLFVVGNGTGDTNPNRSDAIRVETAGTYVFNDLYASGNLRIGDASSDSLRVTSNAWFDNQLNVSGSMIVAGNLTIKGTTTSVSSSNLTIADPIVYIASGSVGVGTKSAIAFASGSQTSNQSLVFGSSGASNILAAAKQDVQAGSLAQSSLSFTDFVPIQASSFLAGGTAAYVSSSNGLTLELGSSTQVLVLSGGSATSLNPKRFNDANFYVSGAVGSRGTSTRGTAVFGGDVAISGSLISNDLFTTTGNVIGAPGSGNNVLSLLSSGNVVVKLDVDNNAAGHKFDVQDYRGISQFSVDENGNAQLSGSMVVSGSLQITGTLGLYSDVILGLAGGTGPQITREGDSSKIGFGADGVIQLNASNTPGEGTVKIQKNSVNYLVLSSTTSDSAASIATFKLGTDPGMFGFTSLTGKNLATAGTDVFFQVSGSSSTKGTTTRGVAVLGGDAVVSGSLYVDPASSQPKIYLGNTTTIKGVSDAAITFSPGGVDVLSIDSYDVVLGSNRNLQLGSTYGVLSGTEEGAVSFEGHNIVIKGNNDSTIAIPTYSDVFLYVSGSKSSKGISTAFPNKRGVVAFGGDVVISGTLYGGSPLGIGNDLLLTGALYLQELAAVPNVNNIESVIYAYDDGAGATKLFWKNGDNTPQQIGTGGGGGDSFFTSTTQFSIFTTGSAAFVGTEAGIDSPRDKGADIFFYVSGSKSSKDGATPGVSMFGGDLMLSGSTYVASGSSILPVVDRGSDLGSAAKRWGNVYTGDLHLRNERGDWTIVEEEDYLCVVNNKTGKKFKMALIPLEE